ncbi:DgyrCDS3099 [Dimorphilus gyrociliatus]|uniref:DgyrCDS3099 n=1 Tax=Dimorphilus gyrociliatus TaxID=2664684 RepID=A0A7I8VC63_9ANNE|nr:DgyrCDS3099 [Dimorphilus gyrociliatus]
MPCYDRFARLEQKHVRPSGRTLSWNSCLLQLLPRRLNFLHQKSYTLSTFNLCARRKIMGNCQIYATSPGATAPYSSTELIGSFNNDSSRNQQLQEREAKLETPPPQPPPPLQPSTSSLSKRNRNTNNTLYLNLREKSNEKQKVEQTEISKPYTFKPFQKHGLVNGQQMSSLTSQINQNEELVATSALWTSQPKIRIQPFNSQSMQITAPPSYQNRKLATRQPILNAHSSKLNNSNDSKYPDPTFGAPAYFMQRVYDISAVEADTIRWERARKFRKKRDQNSSSN